MFPFPLLDKLMQNAAETRARIAFNILTGGPDMKSWERKSDFEILFKDSPDYFGVKNARMILAVNGWVVFHVFDGDTYLRQEMYPTQHIHRIKILPQVSDEFFNSNIKRADSAAGITK